jgi:CheY-like chemotaxis protein
MDNRMISALSGGNNVSRTSTGREREYRTMNEKKTEILIIDDEVDFCRFIKLNLESTSKYNVHIAASGKNGIQAAKNSKPDLILLDVFMPEMDGTVVAEHLLEDASTRDIPIIFLTAVATKRDVDGGGGMIGGRHMIAKPVSTDELISTIRSVLS